MLFEIIGFVIGMLLVWLRHRRSWHCGYIPPIQLTYLEHERDLYARDAITLEEFEFRAGELIELGYADKVRTAPIMYTRDGQVTTEYVDSALKELYRGPIRDVATTPVINRGPSADPKWLAERVASGKYGRSPHP